jgi:hypothetical protein
MYAPLTPLGAPQFNHVVGAADSDPAVLSANILKETYEGAQLGDIVFEAPFYVQVHAAVEPVKTGSRRMRML